MRHKSLLFLICGWLSAWTTLTTHAQTADERVISGRQAWAAGDLNGANEQFAAAVAADPSHETANAFHALTRLLVLPQQPAVKSLLDRLGMGTPGRQILDWTASLPTDQAGVPLAPANFSAQEMITGLHGEVLPEVAAAAANLATITSPGFLLNLTAAETQSEAVTVDLGDLRLIRAGLHLTGYLGQTLNSWNFDAQLTALRAFAQDDERNLQAFLGQHPNLLACSGLADLAAARAEFTSFVENYLAASEFIRTRPANMNRLFNWDSESTKEEAAFRENLTALRASLNSPVPWPDRPALTVNLGRQFADCEAPRGWLPQFQGNALVQGTLPDPTLGGIVQGWTSAEIEQGVIDAAGESLGWEIQTVQSAPQRITGITATATSELASHGRVAANAVNGIYYDTSFWESVGTVEGFGEDRDPAITFDLQAAHQLDHFLIWNSHEPDPAIKRMFVEVSLDGTSFTRLPGEFTLESNGAASGQKVLLGGVAARFVRFDILENYAGVIFPVVGNPIGWSLVAIDEVEFFGTPAVAPVITHHPASLTLTAGQTAQFTVAATGTPPLTYQWRKGGDAVEDGGNISGAAAATLTVVNVQAADAGSYDVVVSNAAGSIPSQPATLVVVPALPAITQQPQSQTVETGDTATFSVGFQSVEGLTYQWLKDGEELPGRTTSQLEISNAQPADEGEYRLRIANGLTSLLSNPATLTVLPPAVAPTITQQPMNVAAIAGQTASFTVTATGTAPLTYQWRKGGTPLNNGGNVSGADTATLTLANIQPADAGSYDVVVSNSAGMDLSEAAVVLVEVPAEPQKITGITATATSELVSHGRLAANAVNGVHLDSYFWESVGVGQGFGEDRDPAITFDLQAVHRLDHLLIWNSHEPPAAIKRMRIELSDDGVTFTALPGEFSLAAALDPQKLALGGSLARFVRLDILENHSGVIFPATGTPAGWSLVAIDEVEFFGRLHDQTPVAPTITQEPQDLTVTAGQTAQFSVRATGSSPLSYQWRKAGTALADGGNISGATTPTLSLANAQSRDAGNYDVVVSNLTGTETSLSVTLTVNPAPEAPTIVQHPANVTGVPAQSVTLSVTAVGTAPLAYQWFHTAVAGGAEAPVAGATSATLTLASLTPAHAGTYRVRVSNAVNPAGAFSQPATVTVVLLEHGFVTRLLPGTYIPGQTFEVVLEARPAAAVAFYAVFDQPPAGWTASGINEGGTFDTQTGRVKFGPFADNAARALRYTLLPPASATGRHQFAGVASADGVDGNIRGSDAIENSLNHSADLNGDRQLVITEITGYGAAWKQGSIWSLPPNPIPVNYVTRAGFLWRKGERYRFDPAAGAAPLWWVPDTAPAPARSIARLALNAASSATRTFAERSVTLAVTPADAISVYAVEERLFAGFTATGVSHGGVFLPEQGLVRWGPFFDHQARELTYTIGAPENFEGEIAVLGLVSEDGDSFPVAGDSVLRFGTAELPPPVTPEFTGDSFRLDVAGPLNARVLIETTDALGGAWTVATEFELNKPDQSWSVPVEIQESGKFFRVRVIVP